jgi:hypothetical protein
MPVKSSAFVVELIANIHHFHILIAFSCRIFAHHLLNSKAVGLSLGTNIHYGVPDSALDLAFSSMFSSMFSSWRA